MRVVAKSEYKLLEFECPVGSRTDTLERHKRRKRDTRFGTWNVRSLYRVGSLIAAARELARYKLDFAHVQEVRWDNGGTVRAGDYIFL